MEHYKFETHSKSDLEKKGNLLTLKANLQPWEFVQFLSTGTIAEEIQPGKVRLREFVCERENRLKVLISLTMLRPMSLLYLFL